MTALAVPDAVARLFWDVDPNDLDWTAHRDYVLERVITRGDWEAMRWLRATYAPGAIRDFLARKGSRLTPRDLAYWALIVDLSAPELPGGGRPVWAG